MKLDTPEKMEKAGVFCKTHGYLAGPEGHPFPGCKQCWRAYFTYMASGWPADEREARLALLQSAVRYIAAHPQEVAFKPLLHPQIENIEKGEEVQS